MVDATIVIPCFNERRRLPPYLATLCKRFEGDPNVTLVVVDDGSDAGELEAVSAAVEELRRGGAPRLQLVRLGKHEGKGAALQSGFLRASTTLVGFVDADGSVDADDCALVLSTIAADPGLDAAIASRVKMLGKTIVRRNSRHVFGRVFATVLTKVFELPVYDSQCGCKFFRREMILPVLAHIESKR
jgi:glycosyltransferase involved in cell wall biosynthesis